MSNLSIIRAEARLQGKTRFYTGVPCRHGHVCERYVSSGGCVSCADPLWRQVKAQIGEDILKVYLRIPGTMTPEKRSELATWVADSCVPAFLNPPQS
jgi:hypothetical protein